jgi:hypothetical protein
VRKIWTATCLLIALAIFGVIPAGAETPAGALAYAEFLEDLGEFFAAESAYLRAYYVSVSEDDSTTREKSVLGVARANIKAVRPTRALTWLQQRSPDLRSEDAFAQANQITLKGLLMVDASLPAVAYGRSALTNMKTPNYEITRLTAIAEIREGNWPEADALLQSIPESASLHSIAEEYLEGLADTATLKFKSPTTAAFLGIIPGGGYAYSGFWRSGISAFVVTTLFGFATYQAFDSNLDVLGVFLAATTVSWYAGSIYGGIASTKRSNLREWQEFQSQFQP